MFVSAVVGCPVAQRIISESHTGVHVLGLVCSSGGMGVGV